MPIITISTDSCCRGEDVAERVSERLGYECVSREIILKASEYFNMPETEMERAIHDVPSVLDRFTHRKERYIGYFRKALLHHLLTDNIVYHGWSGHLFVQGVSHAIKVRIIGDVEDRISVKRRRLEAVSEEEARKTLLRQDEDRRRWSRRLYGMDILEHSLYDMVLRINPMTTEDIADIICQAAMRPCYQATPASRKAVETLYLAAQVQVSLADMMPSARADVEDGEVIVTPRGYWAEGKKLVAKVDEVVDDERTGLRVKMRLSNR